MYPLTLLQATAGDGRRAADSGSDEASSAGDTDSELSDVEMDEDPKPAGSESPPAAGSKKKSKRRGDDEDTEKLVSLL